MPTNRKFSEFDLTSVLGKTTAKERGHFLQQFHESNLRKVLRDGRKPIDLRYYVEEVVCLYHLYKENPDLQHLAPDMLDRLKELVVLGAAQNPRVLEAMQADLRHAVGKIDDPFLTGKLKIKTA